MIVTGGGGAAGAEGTFMRLLGESMSMSACPRCGRPMDPGYLGAENFPAGLQWYRHESDFGFSPGEPVATSRRLQMEFVSGERCAACRIMVLRY